ncbi:metalloregulator ArsR/SmtB family transcription factor [Actinocorallia sp. A-T 12471]|uniref:ArsR/SmtB family transcription factor n=1 Tax=Actinocorallia sp. A-T 12471 TaxID=3089813 RepID=UPI0029D01F62|nr:metalloregulator ArsR/SmtB family transcription factor [Actinocorallia sp. A-T 12471]MDX6742158.1 metalloregulator ArsR/SmtB family transcription factor [Actinocorallia sp. A-T 12471]
MPRETVATTEVLKALSDPIRWNIVQQIAQEEEFACSVLEDTLPVSKTTISYHTKILTQAGLIEVHKRGRNYFYTLRADVLREVIDELWKLAPGPRLVDIPVDRPAEQPARADQPRLAAASGDTDASAGLLTW